jgi:D-glycero-D-manno-heptose 1,7-bisphosphate phosphatase
MDHRESLIVLDRDGVLNRTVPNPAEPRPDSPLRVAEVAVFPWVPEALRALTAAGFGLVVATNQPASAKGKTTRAALEEVHAEVLRAAQAAGGVILSSHICFHRAEDGCACRKPAPGLLVEAFARHPRFRPDASWIVGDRWVDVMAGASLGLRTALVTDAPEPELAALAARGLRPSFLGADLRDFAAYLLDPSLEGPRG